MRIGDLPYPEVYKPARTYQPGLGPSCRRLLPQGEDWEGGWISFVMRTDPEVQNDLTLKQWGSDSRLTRLDLRDAEGRWVLTELSMMRSGYNFAWTPLWEFTGDIAGGPFPGRFIESFRQACKILDFFAAADGRPRSA